MQYLTFLKKNAAFRRQGMRGIRPRAAGPFSDARKGTKSAHKGVSPLWNPRKGARLWLGGRDTHVSARPNLFFCPDRPRSLAPGCAAKPHYTVPDRASLPGNPPRAGVLFVQLRSTLPF